MTDATRLQGLLDDLRDLLDVSDDGGRYPRKVKQAAVDHARHLLAELPRDTASSLSSQHYIDTGRYLVDEDALTNAPTGDEPQLIVFLLRPVSVSMTTTDLDHVLKMAARGDVVEVGACCPWPGCLSATVRGLELLEVNGPVYGDVPLDAGDVEPVFYTSADAAITEPLQPRRFTCGADHPVSLPELDWI